MDVLSLVGLWVAGKRTPTEWAHGNWLSFIGDAIHLTNNASKGQSGRVIPLNRALKESLVALYDQQRGTPGFDLGSWFVVRSERSNKLQKQRKALDAEIRSISDTLSNLETDRVIKRRTPEEVEKIITNIENHRVDRRAMREEVEGKIHALVSRQKWINWVTQFGDRIKQMSEFTPKERHELLGRVVKEIRVRTLGIRSHRLTIKFNLPYHGDSFNWINPKDHSKGFKITGGSDSFDLTVTDAKKNA